MKIKTAQPTRRRIFSFIVLLLGLAWIGISADIAGSTTAGKIPAPQKGFLAPDFQLATLDGQVVTLSGLRGKAILLNFWATWCPPCRAEMPALQRVYKDYKDKGLIVLAVNATSQDTSSAAANFIQQYALTFPILLDMRGAANGLYDVRSLPSSFFIGRDGVIREIVIGGPMAEALIRMRVEKLLEAKP